MFLPMKSMKYYRLWIYTCNAVLFVSVLSFCVAGSIILSDNRRQLVTSVQLYQPSFLYAYLAIFLQGGVIQVMGCVAALRLNEKLLNAYWISLLVLLIGDILVGGMWMVKFDSLTENITADLHGRLRSEYADKTSQFRYIFDDLQRSSQCCGVESPLDYNGSFWQLTETEYFSDYERRALNTSLDEDHIDVDFNETLIEEQDEIQHHQPHPDHEEELNSEDLLLPWSCCVAQFLAEEEEKERKLNEPEALANTIRHRLMAKNQADKENSKNPTLPFGIRKVQFHNLRKKVGKEYNPEELIWETDQWCIYSPSEGALWHHHNGCSEPLKAWINSSGDTLFVIGFCVIAFLKLTFLGILHYEIKEMIQKIQMMHKETIWATPNGDMVRLGTLTSNSPTLDEIGPTEKPIRPTELPGPINTLVSAHGSGQPTITTTQHTGDHSSHNLHHHQPSSHQVNHIQQSGGTHQPSSRQTAI